MILTDERQILHAAGAAARRGPSAKTVAHRAGSADWEGHRVGGGGLDRQSAWGVARQGSGPAGGIVRSHLRSPCSPCSCFWMTIVNTAHHMGVARAAGRLRIAVV